MTEDCIASEKTRGKPWGYDGHKCRCWKCATAKSVSVGVWVAMHPGKREKQRRRYYLKNGEKQRAAARKWRLDHPEWDRLRKREYYNKSPKAQLRSLIREIDTGTIPSTERIERVKQMVTEELNG